MTTVNGMRTARPTLARGAVLPSLFSGRQVEVLSGYQPNPTQMSGYRRLFNPNATSYRPGAYSPRVTRVGVNHSAPSTVGTTTVLGGIDALNERNARYGVAGSRAPYAKHAPRHAGLGHNERIPMSRTPAFGVFETALARTGIPVLYSKFTAPAGQVPNGMGAFDPIPAYTRMGDASLVSPPSPVGCLPGTPGCYADLSGRANAGLRKPWWMIQNEGQATMQYFDQDDSPLPRTNRDGSYTLFNSHPGEDILLPINPPGTVHSIDATGGRSYLPEPGYPNYTSPFGYSGSLDRTPPQALVPSGHDAPLRAYEASSRRGLRAATIFAYGAAAFVAFKVITRRKR